MVHPADEPGEKWDEGGRSGRIGAALDALFQLVMSFGRLSAVVTAVVVGALVGSANAAVDGRYLEALGEFLILAVVFGLVAFGVAARMRRP